MAKAAKRKAKSDPVKIGIIGGSGLYSMAGLTDAREVRVKTPFGDPSDALIVGALEGRRVAFLARARARAHLLAERDQLPREHLRDENSGRRADHFGQRGRIAARGFCSARFRDPGPIFRPHEATRGDVFRRRDRRRTSDSTSRRARGFRRSWPRRAIGGRERPSRRDVRLHGRPGVFDTLRIAHLPAVALRCDRDDESHRGQTRARSGTLLRYLRDGDGLRLLASGARCGDVDTIIGYLTKNAENVAERDSRGGSRAGRRRKLQVRLGAWHMRS